MALETTPAGISRHIHGMLEKTALERSKFLAKNMPDIPPIIAKKEEGPESTEIIICHPSQSGTNDLYRIRICMQSGNITTPDHTVLPLSDYPVAFGRAHRAIINYARPA